MFSPGGHVWNGRHSMPEESSWRVWMSVGSYRLAVSSLVATAAAVVLALPAAAQAPAIDVIELTVPQIQQDYAAHKYTAAQLTQAFLARIDKFEDHYNAFISMNPNALREAAALDAEYARSGP